MTHNRLYLCPRCHRAGLHVEDHRRRDDCSQNCQSHEGHWFYPHQLQRCRYCPLKQIVPAGGQERTKRTKKSGVKLA